MHDPALSCVLKLPAAHPAQDRSEDRLPAALTYSPAPQVVHGVHAAAFSDVLNVPSAHGAHVRSVVAVPGSDTSWPTMQVVFVAHALAALPS